MTASHNPRPPDSIEVGWPCKEGTLRGSEDEECSGSGGDLVQHPQLTHCVILPHLSYIPQHQVFDKVEVSLHCPSLLLIKTLPSTYF